MKVVTDVYAYSPKTPADKLWAYNAIDCMATLSVLEALLPQLDDCTSATYAFSRALQGPVLEMRLRGILVDTARVAEVKEIYHQNLDQLETNLERIVRQGVGFAGFKWRSNPDLQRLFYHELGLPVIKKQGRPTVNRDALEKMEVYNTARIIINHLKAMREIGKRLGVLNTEIDPDNRMRTSYNIAGTSTGRFSSSFSEFGTGTNLQNIEDLLRSIFIADPGMKMAYLDAEQGESRVVGAIEWNLFADERYLSACESGDLHTNVAKLCWPELEWTGDGRHDRDLAEMPYYRHYSRRFMCKKIAHGTNYGGKPRTLSSQAKVEIRMIEDFQPKYFTAFPAHLRWHAHVEQELKAHGTLVSLSNRKRMFWGRRDTAETLREAIAFDPQGSLADIVNRGMLCVWQHRDCLLLLQNHDAVIVQYPEDREDVVIPKLLEQLRVPVELRNGRRLVIPYGVKVGWNFSEYKVGENEDGLREYKPGDQRKRQTRLGLLDRKLRRPHR